MTAQGPAPCIFSVHTALQRHGFGARAARPSARRVPAWVTAPLWLAASGVALAVDTDFSAQAVAWASVPQRAASAFEFSVADYPSLSTAPGTDASPAGLASPTASGAGTVQSHTLTHWMHPERPRSLGVSLGLSTLTSPAAPLSSNAVASAQAAPAAALLGMDMGVRWRSQLDVRRQLDVAAWARAPQNARTPDAMQLIWLAQQPSYGTRVEMQWSSSRTAGLVPEFGAVGVQLESGSRLVVRAKRGKPMLYYRAKF